MRLALTITFGFTLSLTSYAQTIRNDSLIASLYDDVYLKKCFEGLSQSPELASLEAKVGFHFCSITSCVNPFSVNYVHGSDRELIKRRLEAIAERLVKDGTSVILFPGGQDSAGYAKKLNTEKNAHNIRYVSTGNHCEVTETERYFQSAFNSKTRNLLGLEKKPMTR